MCMRTEYSTESLCPAIACQTASRFLPFALLLLRTCLPHRVAILARNPCFRFLLVLLNFVRFFFIFPTPLEINKHCN